MCFVLVGECNGRWTAVGGTLCDYMLCLVNSRYPRPLHLSLWALIACGRRLSHISFIQLCVSPQPPRRTSADRTAGRKCGATATCHVQRRFFILLLALVVTGAVAWRRYRLGAVILPGCVLQDMFWKDGACKPAHCSFHQPSPKGRQKYAMAG